ncbi:MAG: T9SS type A sorting domain-containing protein [candidate division Zixibacteria bacterium]|nr:T9SS type A sorting domain-containing protein [candidate division Zixibacteria bacterium]
MGKIRDGPFKIKEKGKSIRYFLTMKKVRNKMSFKTLFLTVVMLITVLTGMASSASVVGLAFLEGEYDHSDIRVIFCKEFFPWTCDTAITNSSGDYSKTGLLPGYYDITLEFSCLGWESQSFENIYIIGNMDWRDNPDTLLKISLEGELSGEICRPGIYDITDDISVEDGEELVICGGAQFLFKGHYIFTIEGLLFADGSIDDSIVFSSEVSDTTWGGIRFSNADGSNSLNYCRIENGDAAVDDNDGGGVYCYNTNLSVNNCMIIKNVADFQGGGMYFSHCDEINIERTVIAGNVVGEDGLGGGLAFNTSYAYLKHNTIALNEAEYGCAIACIATDPEPTPRAVVVDTNSILYPNDCMEAIYLIGNASCTSNYCDIEGGWTPDTTNIDCDPMFIDPENFDFHLHQGSCCINAGCPSSLYDPDGTIADIGVYPYNVNCGELCDYIGRCNQNLNYSFYEGYWGGGFWNFTDEQTTSIRDGEWGKLNVLPEADYNYFLMNIHGQTGSVSPNLTIAIYNYSVIAACDPATCDTMDLIRIPGTYIDCSVEGLAFESGFEKFWYSAWTDEEVGYLIHLNGNGSVIDTFEVTPYHITGLAYDSQNEHLWGIVEGNPDAFIEFDISNDTVQIIQGPITVPWDSSTSYGAAGLDYDESHNQLIAVNKSNNTVDYFVDIAPADSGGGIALKEKCCAEYTPDPWGIALNQDDKVVTVSGSPEDGPFPLDQYSQLLPPVSIIMVPDDPPVSVLQGGCFTFTGILINNTDQNLYGDVWIYIDLPTGYRYGPIETFNDIYLEANDTLVSEDVEQCVPNDADPGLYRYFAECGDLPNYPSDSSFFEFTVVSSLAKGAKNWTLSDWFVTKPDQNIIEGLPRIYSLSQNYPNPFNATTTIEYTLPKETNVKLDIYNILGQKVEIVVDETQKAGYKSVQWDASKYSSGVYFYKLSAGEQIFTKRMTLLK